MQKFLETKKFFQKLLENFQPPPPTERNKLKFLSRRRRLSKSFLAAATEGRKKLKISSRRRRERRRLTPLFVTLLSIFLFTTIIQTKTKEDVVSTKYNEIFLK
jgi:hypothetical protein